MVISWFFYFDKEGCEDMNLRNNIKTYYFYSIFCDLLILGPILVIFLSKVKGLSFTEIMILQSISAISVVIFEVPTGAIADLVGRKISILLFSILCSISLLIYIFSYSFLSFALAEITFSLGASLRSGADGALIYDSLKALNRENDFQLIEGKARSYSLYAQAIGSILSSFVYAIHPYLPFIISILFMLITGIITLYFVEPPFKLDNANSKNNLYGYFTQIKLSWRYIVSHEKLKAIIIFSMIFFVFYRAGFWYFQPYLEAVNIPIKFFGIIFFIFNMTAAFASRKSHYIINKTKPKTLTFMASLIIISFLLLGLIKNSIGTLAILLQQIARGIYRPVTTKYLNKHIPSNQRATILSFQSLIANIAVAITFPIMGLLKDNVSIFSTHTVLGVTMLIMILLITKYMNERLGAKS